VIDYFDSHSCDPCNLLVSSILSPLLNERVKPLPDLNHNSKSIVTPNFFDLILRWNRFASYNIETVRSEIANMSSEIAAMGIKRGEFVAIKLSDIPEQIRFHVHLQ
jgi:hypothetical protein